MMGKTRLQRATDRLEQAQAENARLKVALERSYDGGGRLWTEGEALLERAEQAEARVKLLYNVVSAVKIGLAGSHRELGAECGEVACTLCWLHGKAEEALAALAEGEKNDAVES